MVDYVRALPVDADQVRAGFILYSTTASVIIDLKA